MSTRAALEAALAAAPGDWALHAAYADLLIEAGDPRGDFVRLQLALEDPDQPAARLRALEREADELRREHEAEWLGSLYPFVEMGRRSPEGDFAPDGVEVEWRRGWVASVVVTGLTPAMLTALARSPATRLVREAYLFRLDDPFTTADLPTILDLWARWPLRHLAIHSGNGDAIADALVASGTLVKLSSLDVSGCQLTDDGAEVLARCPAVRKLRTLKAVGNYFSPVGLAALAVSGHPNVGRQALDFGPNPGAEYV